MEEEEYTSYPSDHELFDPEETCMSTDFSSFSEESCCDIIETENYESKLIKRLNKYLSGIPPPPSVTIPQQTFNEVLQLWNSTISDSQFDNNGNDNTSSANVLTFDDLNTRSTMNTLEEVLSCSWPEVQKCQFYDVNYNRNKFSEKLALLYDKYRERFIGCETSSFITTASSTNCVNGKKIKKNHVSPRRRLSYLTKRRKTFSSESLQALNKSSSFSNWRNNLIIDTKKPKQNTDQLLECTNTIERNNIGSRRCLFNGLERTVNSNCSVISSNIKQTVILKKKSPRKRTPKKRTLERTPKKEIKSQNCSNSENRQLLMNNFVLFKGNTYEKIDSSVSQTSTSVNNKQSNSSLTYTQKLKLLLAVSSALKTVGIGTGHKHFQLCGQQLFKLCRKLWLANGANGSCIEKGTSERMNKLACEHAKDVVNRVKMAENNCNIDLFSQDSSSSDSFFTDRKDFYQNNICTL